MPSTDEWRESLDVALTERRPLIAHYEAYYDGDHRSLEYSTAKFQEAFGDYFGDFATNWCGLVVDVACERLKVQGFRFGEEEADDEAWAIWQENSLDARSLAAHTDAVKTGWSYLLVAPPRFEGAEPVITTEHPSQVICAHDPKDRRIVTAALKSYRDLDGDLVNVVYEPDLITTYRRNDAVERIAAQLDVLGVYLPSPGIAQDWDSRVSVPNPLGEVPVVPLENSPHTLTGGNSDLKPAIALNDAANKFFTDMIVASEFISFPQRVLTGVELPRNPITGAIMEEAELQASIKRVWAFEDPAASVSELAVGSLANYVEGVDLAVQHMAAQTRTPPHYLLAKLANISADALKAAETGLNMRCRRKHLDFSDTWEAVMRLAFKWRSLVRAGWAGAEEDAYRATLLSAETLWMDPESKDPINETQALTNKQTIGVPQPMLWEEAGYTPQQIKRLLKMREIEDARAIRLAAATTAATGGGAPGATPEGVSGGPGGPTVGIQEQGDNLMVTGLPGPPPTEEEAATKNGKAPAKANP